MPIRNVMLPVSILREGKRFIAYTPALDLSTSGKTFEQAKRRFEEAAELFFEEIENQNTLETVLSGLGWRKVEHQWVPPVVVAHEESRVRIPA